MFAMRHEEATRSTMRLFALAAMVAFAPASWALYDASKEYVEAAAVAARYPDPAVDIASPGLRPGRTDFTSQQELEAFIQDVARRSPDVRVRIVGKSQEGRDIYVLAFARPAVIDGAEMLKNGKPIVLIIGQQHGNEPAGGEAALALAAQLATDRGAVLDRINVLVVPRANPDGAFHFVRGLHDGNDVNRDHLLQLTPEGTALGRIATEFQPDVVLDCHEFGVKTRWLEKFGALQGYDALIQYATVSNLPPEITELSERMFLQPVLRAFDAAQLTHSWYYTSSYSVSDPVVSMGGVVPDTGRNIAGLRNSVSFLLETRGVGIGRAHFKRRVYTHLVAMNAFLDAAAANADALLAKLREVRRRVAEAAGRGDVVVSGVATPTRHTLQMVDPDSGRDRQVEVAWRDALELQVRLQRPRPYGYVLPASEVQAARHLRQLGVTVMRIATDEPVGAERYRITSREESRKEDVRRNDEDATPSVIRIATAIEPRQITVHAGDFYVPMDQPLANVVSAALEPETQSSFASNRLLSLPAAGSDPVLPLYRVRARLTVPAVAFEAK
jgi:hypothetical protein